MQKVKFKLIAGFLILLAVICLLSTEKASGRTLYVDDSGGRDHTKIQNAIDTAQDGDTVFVYSGTYNEHVIVDRSINLTGESNATTRIESEGWGDEVTIIADWVNMSGFRITKSTIHVDSDVCIRVESDHNHIFENYCYSDVAGISLNSSNHNIIENNSCHDCYVSGINVHDSSFNIIKGNTCSSNSEAGISLDGSSDNTLENNLCSGSEHGIVFYSSEHIAIHSNSCDDNGYGITIDSDCRHMNLLSNHLTGNGISFRVRSNTDWTSNTIDTTNTVNNKPVCFYTGVSGVDVPGGAGQIILVNCSNMRIEDQDCSNASDGIQLWYSSDITISNSSCLENRYSGIYLYRSELSAISNVICSGNEDGIYLEKSDHNILTSNKLENNDHGIVLHSSRSSVLLENTMVNNGISFWLDSALDVWDTHTIPISNTVNGKPVYYYRNTTDITLPSGAGQVILANCSGIAVDDQNCSDCSTGMWVVRSSGVIVTNSNFSGNENGIVLLSSENCSIVNNSCSWNKECGIFLMSSHNSTISGNRCLDNGGTDFSFRASGINLDSFCHYNTITSNNCSYNRNQGIALFGSDHNSLLNNTCASNDDGGIRLSASSYNFIENNSCSDSWYGISLYGSTSNELVNNSCTGNRNYGVSFSSGELNRLTGNRITGNRIGVHLRKSSTNNVLYYNIIYNNAEYGVDATSRDNGASVNATNNYWGSNSGPYHVLNNSRGKGDNITDFVIFRPWLDENGTVNQTSMTGGQNDNGSNDETFFFALLIGSLGIAAATLVVFLFMVFSEGFRFSFFRLFTPLYTRLNEGNIDRDIEQENIRGRIYRFIKDNPGINFSGVKSEVAIGTGTTVYHLSVLQRERYIRSSASGNRKLFWVKRDFPGIEESILTNIQRTILTLLEKEGEMSRSKIHEKTGIPTSTLQVHIRQLVMSGKVRDEKRGRNHYCVLTENETNSLKMAGQTGRTR